MEVSRTTEVNGTTRFAAAVAILVREYTAEQRNLRFPGVLWFNDQYLVNPQSQQEEAASYRYPCGGAVMAVNRGDPDPRMLLANAYVHTAAGDVGAPTDRPTVANASADAEEVSADPGSPPSADPGEPTVDPGTPPSTTPGQDPSADPGTPPSADPGDPSADPGTPPSADPGDPSVDPGTPPTADPGGPSVDPGTPPSADPGDPSADPGSPPTADPGSGPTTDPGAPPTADPGSPPGADPGAPPSAEPGDPSADPGTAPSAGADANASSDTGAAAAHPVTGTPGQNVPPRSTPAAGPVPSQNVPGASVPPQSFGMSYKETYFITDPNDHTWIIDRYEAYHRVGVSPGGGLSYGVPVYAFPVWVVNVLGVSTFVPDDGTTSCNPYYDAVLRPVFDAVPNTDLPEQPSRPIPYPTTPPTAAPSQIPGTQDSQQPEQTKINDGKCDGNDYPPVDLDYPVRDDPCKGYAEPSRNGYCYGGQAPVAGRCDTAATPLRLYNTLLYFKFEDLRQPGAPRQHAAASTDTNGCHVGTEWGCPAGQEDAEGNSHPFHPGSHAGHADEGPCARTGGGSQANAPTNHGGSTQATGNAYDDTSTDNYLGDGRYGPIPCDLSHATRDIDVYFSASGRPVRPAVALVTYENDPQGSDAPFHDHDAAYGPP